MNRGGSEPVAIKPAQFRSAHVITRRGQGATPFMSHSFLFVFWSEFADSVTDVRETHSGFPTAAITQANRLPIWRKRDSSSVPFSTIEGRPPSQSLVSWWADWNLRQNDQVFLLVRYGWGPLFDAGSSQPAWQGQLIETHSFGSHSGNQLLVASW